VCHCLEQAVRPGTQETDALTNLYNQRPKWLDLAHRKLDAAVFADYNWGPAMSDDDLLGPTNQ
jgi:hypothetical protein